MGLLSQLPERDDVPHGSSSTPATTRCSCTEGWKSAAPRSSSGCELRGAQRGLAAGYLALFSRPVPDLHLRQVVQLRAVRPAWPLKRAPRDGSEDRVKEWGELRLKLRSGSFVSVRVIDWMS